MDNFYYRNGRALILTDLGFGGVRLDLVGDSGELFAILLSPKTLEELIEWSCKTLGQTPQQIPREFWRMIERMLKDKDFRMKPGERKHVIAALKIAKDGVF